MSVLCPNTILKKLEEELESQKSQEFEKKVLAEKSIGLCQLAFFELKEYVVLNGFNDVEEEIRFFKTIKPKVFSKLIFYNDLLRIENYKLLTHRKFIAKVLSEAIREIHEFIKSNKEFYYYYITNQTYLDEKYFVRNDNCIFTGSRNLQYLTDPKFATLRDETVAYFMAYEQFEEYLENEICLLKSKRKPWQTFQPRNLNLKMTWTASKVALVELIYALHCCSCINGGSIHINELISFFELVFDIKLYKAYRAFVDIKERKIDKAKFMTELRTALINRLDDLDALN